jgi:hypothetical protein
MPNPAEKKYLKAMNLLKFDPEGSGYDIETAQEFIDKYPLTIPKPNQYQGDYIQQPGGAFQAWVWHPELNDYKTHSGSLVPNGPKEGMVLKGRTAPTYYMTEDTEDSRGSEIIKAEDGRYYARKKLHGM